MSLRAERTNLAPFGADTIEIASSAGGSAQRRRCLCLLDHPDEVLDLVDHAAHRGRVLEGAPPMHLVEAEALQRRLLIVAAADRAAGLHDGDSFLRALGSRWS